MSIKNILKNVLFSSVLAATASTSFASDNVANADQGTLGLENYVLMYDTDFNGSTVTRYDNQSLMSCADKCDTYPSNVCSHFTYNKSNQKCYLKNSSGNTGYHEDGISGIRIR